MLVADDDNGNYVVVRGMRNFTEVESDQSALTFEVVTTAEGELRLAHTSWFFRTV